MSEGKIWYIALDTEQIGPLSEQEVRDEIAAGSIVGSVPVWRDGMEGWEAIASIDEFSDIEFPPEDLANEFDIADVAGDSVDAFFADYDRSGPSSDDADDADDFLAASVAAATIAAPVQQSAPIASTVAQRSDDSVLFSLDELAQTTRKVSSSSTDTTDGSGLIDLSALASTSATVRPRAESSDEGRAASVAAAAPVAVALAPPKKSAVPAIMLGLAALVIVGLVVVILFVSGVLGKKDEPVAPVADATPEAPAAAEAPAQDQAAATPPAAEEAPVAAVEEDAPAEAEQPKEEQADTRRAERDTRRSDDRKPAERAPADEKPAEAKPSSSSSSRSSGSSSSRTSSAPAASGSGDSVSAALAAIQGGSSAAAPTAGGDGGKTALSDTDIRNTVRRYNRQVQDCGGSEADAGTYRVSFTINPDGSTSGVSPQGGGNVGACVGRVVSGMRFPAHSGSARQLSYTFAIR